MSVTENSRASANGFDRGWGSSHSKTVTWRDPSPIASVGSELSGIDFLSAMRDGKLPHQPIAQLLGIEIVSIGAGDITFRCSPDGSTYNPLGTVHGGLVCTLLDSACGWAAHTLMPKGSSCPSIEIKVSYLRPVRSGETLTAHGWVIKSGARVIFTAAEAKNQDGKVVAAANSSLLVLQK